MNNLNADTHFYELDELASLPLSDLQMLWESVPTEEQTYLARIFEREASKRQIVEDADEAAMSRYFLEQYRDIALVPAGEVWLKVPPSVQQDYRGALVGSSGEEGESADAETPAPSGMFGGLPRWLLLLAVPMVCMFIFVGVNLLTGGNDEFEGVVLVPTETPTPTITPTPTVTPTPFPPTATPFALSGFDDAITAGELPRRDYYPVQLQVFRDADMPPRVFIVQGQEIGVAEWRFDNNPDVVSWLGGMIVRPVLGVPFNEGNLDLFLDLNPDSVFVVTMNTGDVLQFVYEGTHQVTRADTGHFRQSAPGLVLVLIGETFADGAPTDLRYLVTASYPSGQEIDTLSADAPIVVPAGTAHDMGNLTLTVNGGAWTTSANLPPEMGYALVDVQVLTGDAPVESAALNPVLALRDTPGERLSPDPNAAGNCAPLPSVIPPNTAACASLGFVALRGSDAARLTVRDAVFEVPLVPAADTLTAANLDLQLGRITHTNTTFTVAARVFNPTAQPVTVTRDDFGLVLGFIPEPTGAIARPNVAPTTIEPGESIDFTVEFPYAGEGYATLTMLSRVWGVEM